MSGTLTGSDRGVGAGEGEAAACRLHQLFHVIAELLSHLVLEQQVEPQLALRGFQLALAATAGAEGHSVGCATV